MEILFSPCTRYRDLIERQGRVPPEWLRELSLDISTDEFLSADRGFTSTDLFAMLGNGDVIVWLTPHAAIAYGRRIHFWRQPVQSCFLFTVDGKEIGAWSRSSAALSEIVDVVIRLLAASVVHSVILGKKFNAKVPINAATLGYLMGQCQSLKTLTLLHLELDESHFRVIGAYFRPDVEIELIYCVITDAGASVLAEVLGRNQGPTRLDNCYIDAFLIADGLRGNSRLKHLNIIIEEGTRQVLAIADSIRENRGLVEWRLRCDGVVVRNYGSLAMNDETWNAVCDSLKTHPTLEILNLSEIDNSAVITSRVQALLGMMEVNISIHTIHLRYHYSEDQLFQGSVIPYLETNRLRPRVRAIQKTLPIAYRTKVLGRALLAVRTDPNRFWMLVSGNAEVAFPSTAATTAPAANLPTPAIAAATSNTSAVATTAAVTVTATRVASTISIAAVVI
jgi:hypothetical protein